MNDHATRRPKIVVLGDAMLDRDVTGVVERISPEAPTPILRTTGEATRLGGAAAVAETLARLECEVVFVACVGRDEAGEEIARRLAEAGVVARLAVDEARPTTVKTRLVADDRGRPHPLLRVDRETARLVDERTRETLVRHVESEVASSAAALVSDYGKGVVSRESFSRVSAAARRAGVPLLVDPAKGKPLDEFRGASVVKLNRVEAAAAVGRAIETLDDARSAAREIRSRLDRAAAVVTLDRDGAALADDEGETSVSARATAVRDPSGAGDAVLATLGFAVALGRPLRHGLRLAMDAAARRIESPERATLSRAELLRRLDGFAREERAASGGAFDREFPSSLFASPKIVLDHARLAERIEEARRAGRKVAFTNGCFDLLHVGHLATLRAARAVGDALVVAINSDASVARLKGAGRPIVPAEERAAVLAELACVDWVTVFDGDDPTALVALLEPDAIVKGGDYRPEEIAGAPLVAERGGCVAVAPLRPGRSTTTLVARLGSQRPGDGY